MTTTNRPPTSARACRLAVLILLTGLGACGKVSEKVSEAATEKMIEASINKNGADAKVSVSEGGMKVEGTDEKGQPMKMEMGAAQIDEKEMGLPFYPGAKPVEGKSTRMAVNEMKMVQVELSSRDAPAKVSAWYREKVKPLGEGKLVMEQSSDKDLLISLSDQTTEEGYMVQVSPAEGGSQISLMHSQKGTKH